MTNRFDDLLKKHVDGVTSSVEWKELGDLILNKPELARSYVFETRMETLMHEMFGLKPSQKE